MATKKIDAHVYLTPDDHAWVKGQAAEDDRSITREIGVLIREARWHREREVEAE